MDNKQWHGGKGSKRRNSDDTLYADNWEKIFGQKKPEISVRKETPKHAQSKIHKDQFHCVDMSIISSILCFMVNILQSCYI